MIRPAPGVAFTLAEEGDLRRDPLARRHVCIELGLVTAWATVEQVHGSTVIEVTGPGVAGRADAMITTTPGLPLAVFTADCLGIVVHGPGAVGVAHAGWRGLEAGVIPNLLSRFGDLGVRPEAAYVGPGIGPCCFEVGGDVAGRFPEQVSSTSWDTISVDLLSVARSQLDPIVPWEAGRCTMHVPGHHSHRGDGTAARMAAVGWIQTEHSETGA